MLYHMLGAFGEEGPLSLAEFALFLNQPARRRRLHLQVHDLEQEEEFLPLEPPFVAQNLLQQRLGLRRLAWPVDWPLMAERFRLLVILS